MLYQITLRNACFGIKTEGTTVIEAAPIGRWMIGKPLHVVYKWVIKRGTIRRVKEAQ